jgi:uncharacterized membrane protein
MFSGRQIVLIVAGLAAILLGIIGGLVYPLFNEVILNILLYGIAVIVGIMGVYFAIEGYQQILLTCAGTIAVSLGIVGGLSYPLRYDGWGNIILYEFLVISGIMGLLLLINNRGLEED